MAHLKSQETRKNLSSRKVWKLNLIRQLYEQGYARQEIINLFRFIDWVMILSEGLSRAFWQELKAYEEEQRMPYLSSIERIGFEEGIKQGLQQGIEQGARQKARSLVLRLLTRRLNDLPNPIQLQIDALTLSQLELLGEALLDFTSLSDLETWLAKQNGS